MCRVWPRLSLLAVIAICLTDATSAQAVGQCEELSAQSSKLAIPASIAAQENASGISVPHKGLPVHCKVTLTLSPSAQSKIGVEIWLPKTTWNGKFLGTGNSGYAGAIDHAALADGLRRGYAVANTDMGAVPFSLDGSLLVGHRERWKDWGFRATNEMTKAAKRIINAYYGSNPQRSYFVGCSTGGQQGLVEAQRFREDYDGIIAGAPGHNRTHLHTAFLSSYRAITADGQARPVLSKPLLDLINRAVLRTCGTRGGGLASDPYLSDPRDCAFDPKTLQCPSARSGDCLSEQQVKALQKLYDGPRNQSGASIYPGWPRGSEILDNELVYLGRVFGLTLREPAFYGLFKWIFADPMHWKRFDFQRDMERVDQELAPILNAMDPDLRTFASQGRKLLIYHGWADAVVSAQDTINYYHRIIAVQGGLTQPALAETQRFARLFLAPGMAHCRGGPGPNTIFAPVTPELAHEDPKRDALAALDTWVTTGVAPQTLLAVNGALSRPLCPYPQRAHYTGSGVPHSADSFTCQDAGLRTSQRVSTEYER